MEAFLRSVLLKRGIRRDAFWTSSMVYTGLIKYIPLFLDTYALVRSQYWPMEKIRDIQDSRLETLFTYLREKGLISSGHTLNNNHQKPRTSRNILEAMPIVSKKEVGERGIPRHTDPYRIAGSHADHTSGSTGKPLHFFHDRAAMLRSCAVTERTFRVTGTRVPIVYMRARERYGFTFYKHVWFYVRGCSSIQYRVDDFIKQAKTFTHGFILYGYTSWVLELARHIESQGVSLPIRSVMVAGEHLSDSDRKYIERVLHAELFTLYASREVGFLAFECEHHCMHINEEWAYLEIVDARGQTLPAGHQGRIIVTTFDNLVMPFIRYEVGDIGTISEEPCSCGRTLRTLQFQGRTSEQIELTDNRVVSLLDIAHAIGSLKDAVRQYQIIHINPLAFTIRIVPGPLFDIKREYLHALMVRLLHPRVEINWELTGTIPEGENGKAVYFKREFVRGI